MAKALLTELMSRKRVPLLAARPESAPGVYLIFMGSSRAEIVDLLGGYSSGTRPIYCGSSGSDTRARVRRHRQLLGSLPGVDLDEVWVSTWSCRSRASALFGEAIALDALRPPLNEIGGGLGSMRPGAGRRDQRAAVVDALFPPGRGWCRPPSLADQVRARCQLLACLARTGPAGPRWPSLVD